MLFQSLRHKLVCSPPTSGIGYSVLFSNAISVNVSVDFVISVTISDISETISQVLSKFAFNHYLYVIMYWSVLIQFTWALLHIPANRKQNIACKQCILINAYQVTAKQSHTYCINMYGKIIEDRNG